MPSEMSHTHIHSPFKPRNFSALRTRSFSVNSPSYTAALSTLTSTSPRVYSPIRFFHEEGPWLNLLPIHILRIHALNINYKLLLPSSILLHFPSVDEFHYLLLSSCNLVLFLSQLSFTNHFLPLASTLSSTPINPLV